MPQSLSKLYVHLVFSTRNRERVIAQSDGPDLHAYMGGTLNRYQCIPIEINTEPDHAHLLFLLARTVALSDAVGAVKRGATEWLRARDTAYREFHWQSGYGAFSLGESALHSVRQYIRDQHEHHRNRTFQEEYRALLEKYQIDYDERYVWD